MNLSSTRTSGPRLAGAVLLITRLLVAFIFVWHGLPKAIDPAMAMEKFAGMGLPGTLGPVIGGLEVAGGALLTVGALTRTTSVVLAAIMVGAIAVVQGPAGISASLERDLLIVAATFVLFVQGPGLFAFDTHTRTEASPAVA